MSDWNCILPHLYISDRSALYDNEFMSIIQAVVTVIDIPEEINLKNVDYHLKLYAEDDENFDLKQYFPITFRFIDLHIKNKRNVLVHCRAGVSRSVTVVLNYLMNKYKISVEKALQLVREERPQANPNDGFIKQLKMK